jgi:hypothetical protein
LGINNFNSLKNLTDTYYLKSFGLKDENKKSKYMKIIKKNLKELKELRPNYGYVNYLKGNL